MNMDDNENFFLRLREDEAFANKTLLFEPHNLLKRAFDLLTAEPGRIDEIISSIGYSVDKHLSSKNKIKVAHHLSHESANFSVIGLRNLYLLKSETIISFKDKLNDLLQFIDYKEEGSIIEREKILQKITKTPMNRKKPLSGFVSSWNNEMIGLLYKSLHGSYIDSNVTLEQFANIFKPVPLSESFSIQWKSTNVLLAYLIKKVFHEENYLNVWSKAEGIFTKNKKYIKNLKKSEVNNPRPKGHKIIDEILKNIYTHLG